MGFFKNLFGKKGGDEHASDYYEVENHLGLGDGSPLLIEKEPDLEAIFSSSKPPAPQKITESNRSFWEDQPRDKVLLNLVMAYLNHPDSNVKLEMLDRAREHGAVGVISGVIDMLADPDEAVARKAAKLLWDRYRDDCCDYPVKSLRDEIRGSTSLGPMGLHLGREAATRGLSILREEAPDEEARAGIEKLIKEEVIIEEEIAEEDTSGVEFVGNEYQERMGVTFTYEVYKAKSKQEALAFLKTKSVDKQYYYIEVETPEGNFGRDINGIYDI